MTVDMRLKSDKPGITESGRKFPAGTECEYEGHLTGGRVRVRMPNGATEVVNQRVFPTLRG